MKPSPPDLEHTRRAFVSCAGCALLVAACGTSKTESSGDSAENELSGEDTEPAFDPCAAVAEDSWSSIDLAGFPDLQEVGGYVITTISGRSILLAQVAEDCFIGVDSACTHEGETLNYQTIGNRITCPRHAATFALDGTVIAGPTPVALQSYPAAREGDLLWVLVE